MNLSGFDASGARSVRVTGWSLVGPHQHSAVASCTIEVDRVDGLAEVTVDFGDNPPSLAMLHAFISALNRTLSG